MVWRRCAREEIQPPTHLAQTSHFETMRDRNPRRSGNLLVVDDNKAILQSVRMLMEHDFAHIYPQSTLRNMKSCCHGFIILSVVFMLAEASMTAQYKSDATYGVKAGVSLSKVTEIPKMLVSEGYYSGYSFTDDFQPSISTSVFLSYQIPQSPVGIEARVEYDAIKARTTYSDIEKFTYTIDTKFQTIGASAHVKGYAYKGLYLSAGIGYGWNLTSNSFSYSSNSSEIDWGDSHVPSDDETVEELAEAFCGNGLVYLPLALGYELPLGLNFEAFYRIGLNDVITTRANRHDFGEADNRIDSFGLLVGWGFPMDNPDKHKRR